MNNQTIIHILLILFLFPLSCFGKTIPQTLKLSTPSEVAAYYFPTPAILRCLNHSDVPRKFRKAFISRTIAIPGKPRIEQKISIGTDPLIGKKFLFSGNETYSGKLIPLMIDGEKALGLGKGGKIKPSSLFGFGDILGLPEKINVNDKVDNIELKYSVFLKSTKGIIGDSNYVLELNGQDKSINGRVVYFLSGNGKIGKDEIKVGGAGDDKDYYEINEKYGNIEAFTTVKVFD